MPHARRAFAERRWGILFHLLTRAAPETFQDTTLRVQQVAGHIRQGPRYGGVPRLPRPNGRERWPRLLPTSVECAHLRPFHRRRDRRTVWEFSSLVGLPNGLQISTNLSASVRASHSRGTFPTDCYRDLQHFLAVELLSKRNLAEKDCMSLFIRKEDQRSEDRLLAIAWSKIISVGERR